MFDMIKLIRREQAEKLLEGYAVQFNSIADFARFSFTKDKKESEFVKELRKELKLKNKVIPIEEIQSIQETAREKMPFLFKQTARREHAK